MRTLLLGLVALTVALPVPAMAQSVSDVRFSARSGGSSHHGGFGHGDRRRDRGRDDGVFFYDYYREYQGDTAWKSDSFNDWWHDRPDRAYPRWVSNNQKCERKWWAGDSLRC
ncbi:MAG TPA: hypothetical protein VFR36_05480 [Sphingomicrobium sp.]|nr:hypothetical protein [Sphingomicrobium sp.]